MRYFKKWLVLVIAFLLVAPTLGSIGNVSNFTNAAEPMLYVQVDIQKPEDVQGIIDSGIEVIEQYPAYIYGKASNAQFEEMKKDHFLISRVKDPNPVYINGGVIYPANDDSKSFIGVTIPEGFEENYYADVNEPNYYLVKFGAPVKNVWVNQLTLDSIELVEYYHENAYVVRCRPSDVGKLYMAKFVTAVMPYVPAFKVPPEMKTSDEWVSVLVSFWGGVDPVGETKLIKEQSNSFLLGSTTASGDAFSIGVVGLKWENINKLASIPSIQCIELPPDNISLKMDVGRKIVGVHLVDQAYTQGDSPVRLDGSGELVAVFDSGLSGGYGGLSADFSGRVPYARNYAHSYPPSYGGWARCYSGSANRFNSGITPRPVSWFNFSLPATRAYWNGARGPSNYCDVWGHGTHVTSVIGGNGALSGGLYKGVAPNVRFFVQRITRSWDTYDFWPSGTYPRYAYRNRHPRNEDRPAKTHPSLTRPTIWDPIPSPDGMSPGYYSQDEIPYKWDMDPLPPEDIPDTGPFPSFHDVPVVSGEVYGPEFGPIDPSGTNFAPEEGPPNNPGSPYFSGAAGCVNWAMYDAYYNAGARIQNNSWWFYFLRTRQGYSPDPGSPVFSTYDYNAISRFVDNFQYFHQDFLTVWAAGDNGRDRDLNGIVDVQKDVNGDMTYGDPWIDGENQTFFAPAPVKNGITVGACENFRPELNDITYGDISGMTKANFGLFLTNELPEWAGLIKEDLIANANEPLPLDATPEEIIRGYSDAVANRRLVDDPTGKFGMAAISTRGPSSDNRIKPDLVAPGTMVIGKLSVYSYNGSGKQTQYPYEYDYTPPTGLPDSDYAYMSGTSVSAGFVSGASALVRQYYRQVEELNIAPTPTAALIKGTLIHGATNMAQKDAPNQYDIIQEGQRVDETFDDTTSIADPNQGWGLLNVYNALFPIAPRVQKYDDNITGVDADVATYEVFVSNTDVPFEATLCWTDESATPNSWPVLKHNLDLVVVDPAGLIYRGNQFGTPPSQDPNVSVPMATSTDTLNNVERIVILEPKMKGKYTISVVPSSLPKAPGGPVKYALIYSGGFSDMPAEEPIPAANPYILILVALALIGVGVIALRRKHQN
ncbi:MAG: S8 family serine peptidase [Caldisericia bacterium]|nr:S8 family serine peptidase [Caldisericia bacterium]